MARSTRLVILIKNIYSLWGRKRFLLPVLYFPTSLVYPFTLRVTGIKTYFVDLTNLHLSTRSPQFQKSRDIHQVTVARMTFCVMVLSGNYIYTRGEEIKSLCLFSADLNSGRRRQKVFKFRMICRATKIGITVNAITQMHLLRWYGLHFLRGTYTRVLRKSVYGVNVIELFFLGWTVLEILVSHLYFYTCTCLDKHHIHCCRFVMNHQHNI